MGARRPLVDSRGEIVGYEFHLGHALQQRLQARVDETALRAHLIALLASMRLCAQAGQIAYAELPAPWLRLMPPEQAGNLQLALSVLHAEQDMHELERTLVGWRRAGARIGWHESDAVGLASAVRPDFIVSNTAGSHGGATWVAPDLPDIDALEAALSVGARWAASDVRIGAEPRDARALPPQTQHLMQLLHRLVRDDDSSAVVAEIKHDAALSVRLLQYLNSPGISRGHVLASIEQAVAVLGRDALYHWASGLLVRMSPARPAAASLQALALARARLLEMLGRAAGEANPGSLYLLGLCSVLPLLMNTSLTEALATLHLPPPAEQALLSRQGPWADYLRLVEALEAPDLIAASALAAPMGGLDRVLTMSARAWMPR